MINIGLANVTNHDPETSHFQCIALSGLVLDGSEQLFFITQDCD